MPPSIAIRFQNVRHQYGERTALVDFSLDVAAQEIFALLGPNGSGKTTLFRLLSTLIPIQQGSIEILGDRLPENLQQVRSKIGVVFQSPSLDKQLSVLENLQCQGELYGLHGKPLLTRINELLVQFGLADRQRERVDKLSGGLRRRVEIAKGLLHRPSLLILDEPSTGLDPLARAEMWNYLEQIRASEGTTVILTTHLLEEADKADRIAILHRGSLVALGTANELRATVAGDSIVIQTQDAIALAAAIQQRFNLAAEVIGRTVRLEQADGHRYVPQLIEAFPNQIDSITVGKPTLEDVFIDRTGDRFVSETIAAL
ncbi:MAG: ABC transporter ATP-binding protein [Planctomycetota bacterium]|nr:ABC transporter ATP-binding protein [Planctomycetota bacterium]